ncbi:MAG: hypothetical protein CR988_08315 [Treponema sp.]|nr:MAG: hypothetical protein CR988_08315 [Treponema sp.]
MYFLDILKNKYICFEGRARRKEYWMFVLFNFIIGVLIGIIGGILGTRLLSTVYSLALFLPGLGLCIRRLHDLDKDWPWIFISFIPVVGWIWIIVLMCLEGTSGSNQFGDDPKSGESATPSDTPSTEA